VVGQCSDIAGEYYTVNPQAIRTTLDVYGENVRKVVPIDSPSFGRVMTVWVGAMSEWESRTAKRASCSIEPFDPVAVVGSIGSTVKEGDTVKRGDELGWFAFGA
jgi:phosphatidylserine decarboxylase